MSISITILALVLLPVLFILPFNLVRFRWGFEQGLAPMPPDVQERAEAGDRAVHFAVYMILLAAIAYLLHGSLISSYAVGLTTDNWKSATALAALLSYVPLSLGAMLQRILPPDRLREEPESRGPLAVWCGLRVLGSISIEFWRAFCIAALIRLDFAAWAAVLLVAVTYGSSYLTTSVGMAAGAATFGGVAGFLFVKTGSLLAPLTMSLIVAGAQLYRVRCMKSRVLSRLVALEYSSGSEIKGRAENRRRYVTCPVCSASFHPGRVNRKMGTFTCPGCGEVLTYETGRFGYSLFFFCLYGVPALLYYLGYRGFTLLFVSIGAASLMFFFGVAMHSLIVPPKAQQKLSYGDTGLRLTDKPKRGEDHRPTDD
jgi:hypothetical protein